MIVGRLDFLVIKEIEKKFLTSDIIKKKRIGVLNFSYRVIDVPTTQIKYSSSVNLEVDLKKETQLLPYLFNLTAKKAGVEIMYAIFPVLIEKIEDQLAYLGQGGSQLKIGDVYDVFERTDEKIIQKAFKKHIIPFGKLIDSWNKTQQKNPHINEGRYHAWRNDDSMTPKQKIGMAMRETRDNLTELERVVKYNVKLKNELNVDSRSYWKNTHKALSKISERLVNLANKVGQLH